MGKIIGQGAEATIILKKGVIIKQRIPKSYRLPILDEQIRKTRTKRESRILLKAKQIINVPRVLNADKKGIPKDKFNLELEFIEGEKLSETLNNYPEEKQKEILKKLGEEVANLHKNNIIHGDLTTSNVILKENQVYIIDFGLGFISQKIEDMGVDLHLIKQALEAKHFQNHQELFKSFLEGYKWEKQKQILERIKAIEKRGRYRH